LVGSRQPVRLGSEISRKAGTVMNRQERVDAYVATISGVDYALFGDDGRLRRITCVYDRKPREGELD
jgi:regulator of PEP synthase PpsR (kinase-PPPase family)